MCVQVRTAEANAVRRRGEAGVVSFQVLPQRRQHLPKDCAGRLPQEVLSEALGIRNAEPTRRKPNPVRQVLCQLDAHLGLVDEVADYLCGAAIKVRGAS